MSSSNSARSAAISVCAVALIALVAPAAMLVPLDVAAAAPQDEVATGRQAVATRIADEVRAHGLAHERLRHLCDRIGPRLSGSKNLDDAVTYAAEMFAADGLVVRREKVIVPVWRRGAESVAMTAPYAWDLSMLGLGGSVGTRDGGVEADVVVAKDFDDLERQGEAVKGKIVLFNRPMQAYDAVTGSGYGDAVAYRAQGPSRAAAKGAVACLVRSVTAKSLRTPHTGMTSYLADQPRIPAAAIATEDADRIARLVDGGETVTLRLTMGATFHPDQPCANVVADLIGSEKPNEIVLLAAHLDSWDVGQGAQDDGGGVMAVMEAMRTLKALGLKPKRTVRAVLFVNEENGLRGALAYAHDHAGEAANHVAAIEADSGTYEPLGFTTPAAKEGDEKQAAVRATLTLIARALGASGATAVRDGGGGADIGPLAPSGVPQIGLMVEGSRYFDVHHTHADTFDKVSKADLDACAAALAGMAYLIADLDGRLDGSGSVSTK